MTTHSNAPRDTIQRLARAALRSRALLLDSPPTQLGSIRLLPHQVAATHWLLARLDHLGGALLADPPGLGKTFTALAVAAERRMRPLVIAPATLRSHWVAAARSTGVPLDFISTERLSAPATPRTPLARLVIIDEAHHLRTPGTRRHQRTTTLCQHADVLLLSATPIHNTHDDLTHITQLFHLPPHDASARQLTRRVTLRRTLEDVLAATPGHRAEFGMPTVRHRRDLSMPTGTSTLPDAIMALPPLTTDDTHDTHALVQLGLLHALRSSDAAARQRIRHRIAITLAVELAADAGITPTPLLRRAFRPLGSDVQLAMPALVGEPTREPDTPLAIAARAQRGALEAMLPQLDDTGDRLRARVLRRIARWSQGPVVAFTWSRATAQALCHHLRHEPGIALLTGTTARIASGTIARDDVLRRLLPDAHRQFVPHQDRVRLLVTTDVLSEGLSLSGVTTVIHLDLPWTAARLDQRTGRAARIGAGVREVTVTRLAAPLPPHAHAAELALLERKRSAMRVIEQTDAGRNAALIDLLTTLARRAAGRRPPTRWLALQHAERTQALIVALVSIAGRKQLVALDDDGRLRRPAAADWHAIATASRATAPDGQRRQSRERLRAALARVQADRETSQRVARSDDNRLADRRRIDEQLVHAGHARRAKAAADVSAHRAAVMRMTRPSQLATLDRDRSAHMHDTAASTPGQPPALLPVTSRRAKAARILCGVAVDPALRRVAPAEPVAAAAMFPA